MKKYYPISNLFLSIIFLFSSCITIDQKFGDDLIPNEQNILVTRNVLLLSKFGNLSLSDTRSDSFPTSDITVGFIGKMTTPEFGLSKVSLVSQFTLTIPEYTLPSDAIIDSVVMYVAFTADKFGGTDNLTLKVHEVTADLTDSLYYGGNDNFIPPTFNSIPLCSGTFNKYTTTMQMKLSDVDTIGLLSKLKTFDSDTSFKKVFKGIYMTVEGSADGSIKGVDLLTRNQADGNIYYASTFLRMHYKYFHPTAQRDTVAAYTYICQSVNTNKDKRFLITNHSKIEQPLNPTITYTQGLYGVTSNLKFDREKIEQEIGQNLDNIAINRAELRLTLQHPLDIKRLDSFYTPLIGTYTKEYSSAFQPYYAYTLDFNKYVSAVSQGGTSTYDGLLNRTTGTYNIEITHALNNLIRTNNFNKKLILLPQSYGQSFKSAAFIADSTKLVLTYVRKNNNQ